MIAREALEALAEAIEGIPVLGCLEGSPVAAAGVRYGDILVAVNGLRTKSWQDFADAKGLRSDGMEITIFRNGEEKTLEIVFAQSKRSAASILAECMESRVVPAVDDDDADGTPHRLS